MKANVEARKNRWGIAASQSSSFELGMVVEFTSAFHIRESFFSVESIFGGGKSFGESRFRLHLWWGKVWQVLGL
jgi:hypothetical protein